MTKTLEMLEEQLAAAALEAERVAAERTQLKRELQTVQAREEQIRKRSKELETRGSGRVSLANCRRPRRRSGRWLRSFRRRRRSRTWTPRA